MTNDLELAKNRHPAGRTTRAKGSVLRWYRIYREAGMTPEQSMRVLSKSLRELAEDPQFSDGDRALFAMQSFFAGRYRKIIVMRAWTRTFWDSGKVQGTDHLAVWDEVLQNDSFDRTNTNSYFEGE